MENIIISACLLGVACRYDGKSKTDEAVLKLIDEYNLIPICPEILGGLPTPRDPSEIIGDRVISSKGKDVTENYNRGAKESLKIASIYNSKKAILKSKSPSCGCGKIYDGSFSKTLIDGDGITTRLFKENGIKVYTEDDVKKDSPDFY